MRISIPSPAARLFVGAGTLATAVAMAVANSSGDDPDLARLKAAHHPDPGDYAAILLPSEPPPAGADLKALRQVGTDIVTEQMRFQYNGYTVTACSVQTAASAFDPCKEPDGEVLRTVTAGGWRTTYSASTKFEDPVAQAGPAAVVAFFRTAELVVGPDWVDEYVDGYVKELYG